MSKFTLDDIRAAAEAKYADTEVRYGDDPFDVCKLVNPLRLPKDKRAQLTGMQAELDADSEKDEVAILERTIRLVAASEGHAEQLIAKINGDLTVLSQLFSTYAEGVQAGEASASPN
jgi:hypothetical protein